MKIEVEKMKMKKNLTKEDEENQKNLVLVVHRYIKWTCNLMAEIISKIDIKNLTEG